jgi:opacity protein-like surface antigen
MRHNLPVDSIPCLKIGTLNEKGTPWKGAAVSSRLLPALALLAALLTFPASARAQGLELSGGWAHVTGDFGTDGFDLGAAWWFTHRITIAANYDSTWNDTTLGVFAFTQVGAIGVKSHLQSFIVGPRIFFTTQWTNKHKLDPFGEAQFGVSHLNQKVVQANLPTVSASDSAFTWELGGGAEYLFTHNWSGRANLDLLRTHFSNEAQNHFRLVLGVTYTFGERGIAGPTK